VSRSSAPASSRPATGHPASSPSVPSPRRWRLLSAALAAGLLVPGLAVAAPAAADSDVLNPLDQSTQFDDSLPPLDESLLAALEGRGRDGETAAADAATTDSTLRADAATAHLGPCRMDFRDAPPGGVFYRHITWMACEGLTKGYANHTFGVTRSITREETARMLYRMSGETHRPGAARDFTDVTPRAGDETFIATSWMQSEGISSGYRNGAFGAKDPISRGELAAFLFRFAGDDDYEAPRARAFTDVSPSAAAHPVVSWLRDAKITAGYRDGTFRPARNITRQETAGFLYRLETHLNGVPAAPSPAPRPVPKPQPTPAPEVPLAYRYVVIADDGLNLRRGPGTAHGVLRSLARNTKVVITGRSQAVGSATWREIVVGSQKGWVNGGYLIKDFEANNAKSALSRRGQVTTPSTRNGVTVLGTTWVAQPNGYWCGPASIKIALSAYGLTVTQKDMAREAQTDTEGTWLHQVGRVLDHHAPASVRYSVTTVPGANATAAQKKLFREDMRRSIRAGVPAVVNIAATPAEQAPLHREKTRGRFTLRHHMAIVGYNENNHQLLIHDPWTKPFWISADRVADMAGTRGYLSVR
jgi:uncharacterized protein YgiM (DUF1202 family)